MKCFINSESPVWIKSFGSGGPLAGQLSTILQLIRADTGIRIFYTGFGGDGIGGFDNHANKRDNHAALLRYLSESVAAFVDDLARQKLLDRVVLGAGFEPLDLFEM